MIEKTKTHERSDKMEADRYRKLIQQELAALPDYVMAYYRGTNLAMTTTYQYLTEFRRFFNWLRANQISHATDNQRIATTELAHLRREDIMLYIDDLKHTKNAQGRANSATSINRSLNALRSLFKFLTITADNND